jgi:hypothetical protein
MNPSPQRPRSPLLSDEELEALIQAFNRRESDPRPRASWPLWLVILGVSMLGWSWWQS